MKTETQPKQPVSSNKEVKQEDVVTQPAIRRVAYKTVLSAPVIGIITIGSLWLFSDTQDASLEFETPLSKLNIPLHGNAGAKEAPAITTDTAMESAFKYDKTYFDKIVSSVGPLMEKITTGKIAELISPDYLDETDSRPIFEWMDVIRRKGIVYVGLDALTDTTVASAVGNSMFADLVSVAGHIYKHGVEPDPIDATSATRSPETRALPTISLHADEFNELIGDEFVPLLNKAGGAGFQVTTYTQTWSDVEARIGNRAKAGQVAGNFNSMIMLRVKELATAEMLTDQLPKVEVFTLMSVSGVDDSSDPGSGVDFKSRNEDRISVSEVPMLTPAELVTLPKGQAFALLEGGHLWKLRMPLPDIRGDQTMPEGLADIANEMERTYITNDQWYRIQEPWWMNVADASAATKPTEDTDA